jgi:glycosyltransferase involved in cell wall biosynthesis
MKKLEIILPFYGEDVETIQPMLSSINNQIGCTPSDYLLTLVDDCGPSKITEEDVKKYLWKFDFKILHMEKNGGPGNARQFGIDNSKAEYVFLGDCDDMLQNNMVFHFFEKQLYKDQPDFAHTKWYTHQYAPNMGNIIVPNNPEFTWFFGKFYKREFLEKYKLREDPRLRVHEEIQIVRLAPFYSQNAKMYDFPTYIWSTSEGSITRKNNQEYAYTGMATYIFSNDILLDKMVTLNRDEALKQAMQCILLTWSSFQNCDYDNVAKDWKQQTEEMASYFINKWQVNIDLRSKENPQFANLELEVYKGMQGQLHSIPKEDYFTWKQRMIDLNITEVPEFKQPDTTTIKKGKD